MRVLSAFFFMIPWMDVFILGREMYHRFPHTLIFYYLGSKCIYLSHRNRYTPTPPALSASKCTDLFL